MASPQEIERFVAAVAADCAGRQKQVAADAFPDMRVEVAEAEATNVLHLRRRPTFGLLLDAMADGDRAEALAMLAERAGYRLERLHRDPARVREEVRGELADLGARIANALRRMEDADAEERQLLAQLERRGPHRAASAERRKHA